MPTTNARYRVVENGAYLAPGVCKTCNRSGSSDDRGMIDTTIDDAFYGVIYICSYCILEMAEQYGAASPTAQLNNLTQMEALASKYEEVSDRLTKAEGVLSALGLNHLLDIDISNIDTVLPAGFDAVEVKEPTEAIGDGNTDGPFESGEAEQQSLDISLDSERSDDFFGSDGPDDEQSRIDL